MKTQRMKGLLEFPGTSPGLQPLGDTALGGGWPAWRLCSPQECVRVCPWRGGGGDPWGMMSAGETLANPLKMVSGASWPVPVLAFDIPVNADTFKLRSQSPSK